MTGRCIDRHMAAQVNELIAGEYNHTGDAVIYCDTDSLIFDSIIKTYINGKQSDITIEDLFHKGTIFWKDGEKEYSRNDNIQVIKYDNGTLNYDNYNYVYRHKVSKKKYKITDSEGNSVTVTNDHSIMVLDDGVLIEKNPSELVKGDKIISNYDLSVKENEIKTIEELPDFEDEYVYDIGVDINTPYFFANNILVHNSSYFSAYPILKDQIESGEIKWDKETAIEFYDAICEEVNKTFPKYMRDNHNCPDEYNYTIAAGREIIGSKALYIKKKRYSIMVYDDEGNRMDTNGKHGKLKAMGLDLKRSDTPIYMQDFLKEILHMLLTNSPKEDILDRIKEFRDEFRKMNPWEKGTPKRVNKLLYYYSKEYKINKQGHEEFIKKANMPGHVRAAINYNRLLKLHNDKYSIPIVDGMKTIVCKLKDNPLGITSIGIPTDEKRIPEWFKELPFDDNDMEDIIVNKKIENLLGVLDWDLDSTKNTTTFDSLFDVL